MPKISAKSKLLKKKKNNKKKQKKVTKKKVEKENKFEDVENKEIEKQIIEEEEEKDLSYLLQPIQAHDLKNGQWCIDDKSGYPGVITNLKMSKTGKHGHAKYTYKLVMPHTGKTSNPMHPGNDNLQRPIMNKQEYKFIKFMDDQQQIVQLKDNITNKMYVISISPQPKAYGKVMNLINKRKGKQTLNLQVLSGPKYSKKQIDIVQCVIG
eukprot:164967_1